MNYHNITYPDMNNGDGLRVVLWLSGCNHHCKGCQNPQTWDDNSGILFDKKAKEELLRELDKDYISGITLSGGDPLHESNIDGVLDVLFAFNKRYKNKAEDINHGLVSKKTIWLYTGYKFEKIMREQPNLAIKENYDMYKRRKIIKLCDVLVDGRYIESKRDLSLKYRGSSNQRVIDIQRSLHAGEVVLWTD